MRLVSNRSASDAAGVAGVSKARVVQASTVLRYAPEQAEGVLSGAIPLDAAYEKAREAKAMAEGRDAVFAELKMRRADLADQVVEGRLTLEAATAAMKADEERVMASGADRLAMMRAQHERQQQGTPAH